MTNEHSFATAELTEEAKAILQNYLNLKAELSALEEQVKAAQPEVLELLIQAPKGFINFGEFQINSKIRHTYEYSLVLQEMESVVRQQKRREEKDGTAEIIRETLYSCVQPLRNIER